MPIEAMSADQWIEKRNESSTVERPTWKQVEEAIRRLDCMSRTIVTLHLKCEAYMMVAGGWHGCYLVIATVDNLTFFNLTDPSKSDDLVMMDVGGQGGEYPVKRCVALDVALRAAKTYFETGQLLMTDLTWEEE